jgi:hypothetical protein
MEANDRYEWHIIKIKLPLPDLPTWKADILVQHSPELCYYNKSPCEHAHTNVKIMVYNY